MPNDLPTWILYTGAALGLIVVIVLWRALGRGPRRARALRLARRQLHQGHWGQALEQVRHARRIGNPSTAWCQRLDQAEADCLDAARQAALVQGQYEEALEQALKAASLRGRPEIEARAAVQSAMLADMRRRFASGQMGDTKTILDLASRVLLIQAPCREASFWQGLCHLRDGQIEQALTALQTARTGEARTLTLDEWAVTTNSGQATGARRGSPDPAVITALIDPPLYIGAILLRQGQAKESLKYLTEANRIDANCPVVSMLLGAAIIDAGGDANLAIRALERALGARGFQQWSAKPQRLWVEAFPEGRSYVRKLAEKHAFVCPLWGGDLTHLVRQGTVALAQGLYRQGNYQEAAVLFGKAIQEGAPSLSLLRGLGLSLARVGKYDDAFKPLLHAHEMANPKDRITAGYLALCGARGSPSQPEDLPRNIAWAVKMVNEFTAPGDEEWVNLVSAIYAEARAHQVPLNLDEQLYLCEHLVSIKATDPLAAQAYHHLQATFPQALHPEYAWLFGRAAQQHTVGGAHTLALFERTFAGADAARAFFSQQGWDFEALEYTCLQRAAELDPGHFPAVLGPDYAPRGEALLLARSETAQRAGQADAALASATILAQLAPASPRALDRLARLHYERGAIDQALDYLQRWRTRHPDDPLPYVRQAILAHQEGKVVDCFDLINQAIARSTDRQRARIGVLGARLLAPGVVKAVENRENSTIIGLAHVGELLNAALAGDLADTEALWLLAAVRWLRGDHQALAQQAPAMDRTDVVEPAFHHAAGLCRLAAQDYVGVLEACARVVQWSSPATVPGESASANGDAATLAPPLHWPIEAAFLSGLAHQALGDDENAAAALRRVAEAPDSPSVTMAAALLGLIAFRQQDYAQAARWWEKLDAKTRSRWQLGAPLGGAVFLQAVQAFHAGRFEECADKLRQAGRLGCRDRRLGPLLLLALFKAGQQAIYGEKP